MPDLQDAISLLEKGNAREASLLLETMAGAMPGYATARVLLARAYEGLGEWDGALGSWREALQIVPNSPVIRRGLERAARKAASRAPIDELPELPSMSVSTPVSGEVEVAEPEAEVEPASSDEETAPPEVGIAPPEAEAAPEAGAADADAETAWPAAEPAWPEAEPEWPEAEPAAQEAEAPSADTGAPDAEDLDRLISELESARIVPRPDVEGLPEPTLEDDIEDVVSVTLARIYASQGEYDEAARVYELLAGQQPENEQEFRAKAAEMRSKASED